MMRKMFNLFISVLWSRFSFFFSFLFFFNRDLDVTHDRWRRFVEGSCIFIFLQTVTKELGLEWKFLSLHRTNEKYFTSRELLIMRIAWIFCTLEFSKSGKMNRSRVFCNALLNVIF